MFDVGIHSLVHCDGPKYELSVGKSVLPRICSSLSLSNLNLFGPQFRLRNLWSRRHDPLLSSSVINPWTFRPLTRWAVTTDHEGNS
jgi:hypothetical protein